ncbi:hypothetical protein C0W44_09505 [Photobacterium leiognathi subsp. mandapamensis]|nr:hypothetical protein C0W44_09505 [Photobacterium leiognathi subsp. mandapamensis]
MKRVITGLILSLALHSLSAFATTQTSPHSMEKMAKNTIEYLDHTHKLDRIQQQQSHMLATINNNNYLLTNGHKEGHLERGRWEETRTNRTNTRCRVEHKNK